MNTLPIIEWNNMKWFVDTRLEEIRKVGYGLTVIKFQDIEDPELSELVSEKWSMAY